MTEKVPEDPSKRRLPAQSISYHKQLLWCIQTRQWVL